MRLPTRAWNDAGPILLLLILIPFSDNTQRTPLSRLLSRLMLASFPFPHRGIDLQRAVMGLRPPARAHAIVGVLARPTAFTAAGSLRQVGIVHRMVFERVVLHQADRVGISACWIVLVPKTTFRNRRRDGKSLTFGGCG